MNHLEAKIAYLKADNDKANAVVRAICTRLGVSEDEFAVAKAARAKPAAPVSVRSKEFNLAQFSSAGATAIMAANAKSKFLPDRNDADFEDGSADGIPADDDDSTWAHTKRAANHLEMCLDADSDLCNRAPMDDSPDHLMLAHRHLTEALAARSRGANLDLARTGQMVRFA